MQLEETLWAETRITVLLMIVLKQYDLKHLFIN